jgi:ribose transport system substrate-binding protein
MTVLEQVISKKPAGIAISAVNSELLTATINKAVESGIPVVLFDSGAPDSKAYSIWERIIIKPELKPHVKWRS